MRVWLGYSLLGGGCRRVGSSICGSGDDGDSERDRENTGEATPIQPPASQYSAIHATPVAGEVLLTASATEIVSSIRGLPPYLHPEADSTTTTTTPEPQIHTPRTIPVRPRPQPGIPPPRLRALHGVQPNVRDELGNWRLARGRGWAGWQGVEGGGPRGEGIYGGGAVGRGCECVARGPMLSVVVVEVLGGRIGRRWGGRGEVGWGVGGETGGGLSFIIYAGCVLSYILYMPLIPLFTIYVMQYVRYQGNSI